MPSCGLWRKNKENSFNYWLFLSKYRTPVISHSFLSSALWEKHCWRYTADHFALSPLSFWPRCVKCQPQWTVKIPTTLTVLLELVSQNDSGRWQSQPCCDCKLLQNPATTDGVIRPGAEKRLSHILTGTTLTPREVQTHWPYFRLVETHLNAVSYF